MHRKSRLSILPGAGLHCDLGIVLNEKEVPWTPEDKFLEVTRDKRLTFASHTAKSIEKAERAFRILYSFLNRKSNKLLLYKSCIRPILCYGLESKHGLTAPLRTKKSFRSSKTGVSRSSKIVTGDTRHLISNRRQTCLWSKLLAKRFLETLCNVAGSLRTHWY
jgi:hypothetical protein